MHSDARGDHGHYIARRPSSSRVAAKDDMKVVRDEGMYRDLYGFVSRRVLLFSYVEFNVTPRPLYVLHAAYRYSNRVASPTLGGFRLQKALFSAVNRPRDVERGSYWYERMDICN